MTRVLGEEVLVGKHGVGRVTELDPQGRWIGVTPYVAGYQMNFEPRNVKDPPRRLTLRNLVREARRLCRLSHGCRAPMYTCDECPFARER